MSLPSAYPLSLYRGDTVRLRFLVWADAAKTQPVDLTGVVAKAEIRNQPSGATIVAFTCTVTVPNTIDLVLPAAQSRLVPSRGVWDLQLTYPGGDVTTILAGPVTQTADVTDSTMALLLSAAEIAPPLRLVGGF